jgi:hypothetical protein
MPGLLPGLLQSMQNMHSFTLLHMASPSCIPQKRRGSRHLSRGLPGDCALLVDS